MCIIYAHVRTNLLKKVKGKVVCFSGSSRALVSFIAPEKRHDCGISRPQIDSVPSSLSRTLKGYFIFEEIVDRSPVMSKINLVAPAEIPMASRVTRHCYTPTPPLPDSADGLIEFESTAGFLHLGLPSSRLLRRHSQQPLLENRHTSSPISLTIYTTTFFFHLAIETFHCSICFVDFAFVFVS